MLPDGEEAKEIEKLKEELRESKNLLSKMNNLLNPNSK